MAVQVATRPLTNMEIGDRLGIHHSMASRLRHGQRLPSADLQDRISVEFGVSLDELGRHRRLGAVALGRFLHEKVFLAAETAA